jgi:hypothetical protein
VAHQLGDVLALLLDHPAALAADPAAADEEHLDGGLELVVGEREDVGVGLSARTTAFFSSALLRRRGRREAGGELVLLGVDAARICRSTRLVNFGRVAGHEVAEVLGDLPVLLRSTGRRTGPSTCRCSRAGTGRPLWWARLKTPVLQVRIGEDAQAAGRGSRGSPRRGEGPK